jgi:hypothetical protein
MAITASDVKLVASEVMLDVAEGGGAPSSNFIADGVSNSIFPDISELDRAAGRVNLRKVFASVQTNDTSGYFGCNVIVAEPPKDPRVSVTLFSTAGFFDDRAEASTRIESYLAKGGEWGGVLWENHIVGQRAIQLFQRPEDALPAVGQTLVLTQNEDTAGEKTQYVRVTSVSSVDRRFFDRVTNSDFLAKIVTLNLSDSLRYDFTGSPADRGFGRSPTSAKVRDTVVADAGMYCGVSPLTTAAAVGDFSVTASSVFTQLVPSAQTETAITDVRCNGVSAALVSTGGPVTKVVPFFLQQGQTLYAGSPILPGSVNYQGVTDSAGLLKLGGAQVGTVDYDNGTLSMVGSPFAGVVGNSTLTFTPATVPSLISEQRSVRVTAESRSLNYTLTLENIPAPRSTSVSYLAQGRWYVLRDDGSGVLKGTDSAFGAGTVSFSSGSLSVTLGALPDVGSSIVIQSFSPEMTVASSNTSLLRGEKVYVPINSSGLVSAEKGVKPIAPLSVDVTWAVDGTTYAATDNGNGSITGAATGTVDYANGVIYLSPTILPPAGTTFSVDLELPTASIVTNVSVVNGLIGNTNIRPTSISFPVEIEIRYSGGISNEGQSFSTKRLNVSVYDTGGGTLVFEDPGNGRLVQCGSVNYQSGTINLNTDDAPLTSYDSAGPNIISWSWFSSSSYSWDSRAKQYPSLYTRTFKIMSATVNVSSAVGAASSSALSAQVNNYFVATATIPNYVLSGVSFDLGGRRYEQLVDGTLRHSVNPATGLGTPCGSVSSAAGVVTINSWVSGQSSAVTNWRGLMMPPTELAAAPFTASKTVFRTAAAPLRPGTFSVLGSMFDGTTFNVTAGVDGSINTARVKGKVNYEFGLVELYFTNPANTSVPDVDLSFLGIPGLSTGKPDLVRLNSIRYNTTSYSYIPLDADVIGIDPVRLPTDGRVPIFRPGGFAVVGHTGTVGPATVSNGQTVNCGRVRLSRVRVVGANGAVITTGYTANLDAGTVTFTNITGYSQPVTVEHRIEDMALVSDSQINGQITFTRPLTHAYPLGSYVSSALIAGDMQARVAAKFDQSTWAGVWSDSMVGGSATATFNFAQFPITVTNKGAVTERWAIVFTSSTGFQIIGENVGVIGTGGTGVDCSPINLATNTPYFTIPALGWGLGWTAGNVLRFNTVGSQFPVWVARTILQGPETVTNDDFTLLVRGDIDTP